MSAKRKEPVEPISLTYDIDDEQEELSVDPIQLNATLLAFRPIVRKARLHVLRELAIYIKRLKQKQSVIAESKKARIGKKILGRLSELRLLKKMDSIRLCKLLLANLSTVEEMEKAGQNMNKQDRLVVRMAARPEVAAFVNQFRTQHTDWPTLVHFLLYKNTSGKWKTSEQKRRRKKKNKGDLPFPLPASLPSASDEEGEDREVDGCSTIKKFAAFKEAHDRRLLEEQKKLIADEEAEFASLPPPYPQTAEAMDADIDAASEIVANLIARRPAVLPSNRSEAKTEVEKSGKARKNKSKKEKPKKLPQPSTPPDDRPPCAERPQKKAKIRKESSTKADMTVPTKGVKKAAVMEAAGSTKVAKINKPTRQAPADAFFSEVIDATEPQSEPILDDEDEALFGADDVELKNEIRAKKTREGGKTLPDRGAWQRGGRGSDRRGWGMRRPRGGRVNQRGGGGAVNYSRKSQSDADTAGLHPSWVAKREQKRQAAAITLTPAAGKRVVFEE
ncbi:hypothetical protein SprV_0301090400 [Sparganum proliferum]